MEIMEIMVNGILRVRMILFFIACLSFMNLNGQNLNEYKWKNRILIVKSNDMESKKYQEQLQEFTTSLREFVDRRFILCKIIGEDFVLLDYSNSVLNSGKISGELGEKVLSERENFEILLIGLDGGIKLKQTKVLMKEDLFQITDSMPMRREELIRNKN